MTDKPPVATLNALAMQNRTGPDAVALERRTETAIWEWSIESENENSVIMVDHQDMLRYNMGDKVTLFDGGANSSILNRVFVGYGNGTQTQFLLPYRNIYAPSLVISVNNTVTTGWTLSGKSLTFNSAPANLALIHIEKARMRFKAYFVVDTEKMYQMTDMFKSFSSGEIKIREFPN